MGAAPGIKSRSKKFQNGVATANGGSSSLDRCLLTSLGFRGFRYDSYFGSPAKASKYSVSNTLDTLRLLFEQGAQWRPDEPREIAVELIEQLTKHNGFLA